MTNGKATYYFILLKRKFQLLRSIEILLWSVAIGAVCFYVSQLYTPHTLTSLLIALVIALNVAVAGSRKLHIFDIRGKDLAIYINRQYPLLEESSDLLLQEDETLTSLQKIQKAITVERFEAIYPTIKIPHHIERAVGVLLLSAIISTGLIAFSNTDKESSLMAARAAKADRIKKQHLPVFIKNAVITIYPPTYTGLKNDTRSDLNLKIPESSDVMWEVIFDGEAISPKFIFSGKDTVNLISGKARGFQISRSFEESGFYQIAWTMPDSSTRHSDYFKVEIIKDEAPVIAVENLNQFAELKITDNLKVELKAILTDDYGLSRGHVIATVSKGSGEAIKFREEKLDFDRPKKVIGKNIQANRTIDLLKLGLQPGDELYFYIEAFDVKSPEANRARTETYFISLQDTSSLMTSVDAGLAVDLMPEYFRSQRQIIIDSEKLLREKKRITKQNFNSRSNELGYDQKVLRMRYGEFLGEEFESGIGPQHEIQNKDEEENVNKKLGHSHDTKNEHNLVDEKKASANVQKRDHAGDVASSEQKDPLKEFIHAHDGNDEASFFIQSIKAKLKAAITIMWDAELYLRLSQPEKSLPYQYRALKLLKEISQDSRIFVHRTGFDPPPLKEDKRLTGDLSEIENSTIKNQNEKKEPYPEIRTALLTIEALIQNDSIVFTSQIRNTFTKAGQELATLALMQPGKYLQSLSLLKSLAQDEIKIEERLNALISLRSTFWNVIPPKTMSPQGKSAITHDLDVRFLENLEAWKPTN